MTPAALPPGSLECPACHAFTMRDKCPKCGKLLAVSGPTAPGPSVPVVETPAEKAKTPKQPNKTEQRYYDTYLEFKDARYEAVTWKMANGHRYKPDWIVFEAGRPVECIEVKSYRFHSQGRARLAFDQAKQEFNGLRWTWATWDGKFWTIERL